MRKTVILMMLLAICISGLVSCGRQNDSTSVSSEVPKRETVNEPIEENSWSEQDIIDLFENVQRETWEYIACVLTPDYAYDRVGAVLFQDVDKGTCNVAFFAGDGSYQQCGVYATPAEEANFTYEGDGTVSFQLETENGDLYTYTISLSIEETQVYFKAESDLYQG